jgi:hypothetical protein
MNFFLFLTFAGSLFGLLGLLAAIFLVDTATGQAAAAAISIGLAVIPYCMMRVLHIDQQMRHQAERQAAVLKLLTLIAHNTSKKAVDD